MVVDADVATIRYLQCTMPDLNKGSSIINLYEISHTMLLLIFVAAACDCDSHGIGIATFISNIWGRLNYRK